MKHLRSLVPVLLLLLLAAGCRNIVLVPVPEDFLDRDDETAAEPWTGEADTSWYAEGSSSFSLDTPEALAGLSELVEKGETFADKTVTLETDMDLNGKEWTPIGKGNRKSVDGEAVYFSGTFDGNGKTISNFTITGDPEASADQGYGFFNLAENAVIKDISFENAKVSAPDGDSVGILLGYGRGNIEISGITIDESSSVTGYDSVASVMGRYYAEAGNATLTMSDIESSADVTGEKKTGGIAGIVSGNTWLQTFRASDIVNRGIVTGKGDGTGGIFGYHGNIHDSSMERLYNYGDVRIEDGGTAPYAGGIIGYGSGTQDDLSAPRKESIIIRTAENHGDVMGNAAGAGGLAGIFGSAESYDIFDVWNYGNISGAKDAGGIIGSMNGSSTAWGRTDVKLTNAHNSGDVTAINRAGGIFGVVGGCILRADSCVIDESCTIEATTQDYIQGGDRHVGNIAGSFIGYLSQGDAEIRNTDGTDKNEFIANVYSNGDVLIVMDNCNADYPMDWVSNAYNIRLSLLGSSVASIEIPITSLYINGNDTSEIGKLIAPETAGVNIKYTGLTNTPEIEGTGIAEDDSILSSYVWTIPSV